MPLTVKHAPASGDQIQNGRTIVQVIRSRGGDLESCAGAVATAIQESTLRNIAYGDAAGPDSRGLFQQRNSWGSLSCRLNPACATGLFADQYLSWRKRGFPWVEASYRTQRCAARFKNAPAQWYSEGIAFARAFTGAGGPGDLSLDISLDGGPPGGGVGGGETRVLPYEFTRGSADKRENSWDCIGRLADEVKWRRYMRAGELWYVSDDWLTGQKPVFRLSEGARGVVNLSFDFETRAEAAQATVTVQSDRYTILPGDLVELTEDEGPAEGLWLVSGLRRSLYSSQQEVTLTRREPTLEEPAPEMQTVNVGNSLGDASLPSGGIDSLSFNVNTPGGNDPAGRAYRAAEEATKQNWRYSQPRRNQQGPGGYADCSSGVSWVLNQAGIPLPGPFRPNAPTSGMFMNWGEAGYGSRMTVMSHGGHVWIAWHNMPMKRFDTGGGSGGRNWPTRRSAAGFTPRHPRGG